MLTKICISSNLFLNSDPHLGKHCIALIGNIWSNRSNFQPLWQTVGSDNRCAVIIFLKNREIWGVKSRAAIAYFIADF